MRLWNFQNYFQTEPSYLWHCFIYSGWKPSQCLSSSRRAIQIVSKFLVICAKKNFIYTQKYTVAKDRRKTKIAILWNTLVATVYTNRFSVTVSREIDLTSLKSSKLYVTYSMLETILHIWRRNVRPNEAWEPIVKFRVMGHKPIFSLTHIQFNPKPEKIRT